MIINTAFIVGLVLGGIKNMEEDIDIMCIRVVMLRRPLAKLELVV